jgi:hypothetical protein
MDDSLLIKLTFNPNNMITYADTLWVSTSIDTPKAWLWGVGIAPLIASEPDSLLFPILELGMVTALAVTFQNQGNDILVFYDITTSDPVFKVGFTIIGDDIPPGETSDTCWVTFYPTENGLYIDSLFVGCNAFNAPNDTFMVCLQGEGGLIPDTVRNLTIETDYPNAILNWDPVTTTIYGSPITVDYYLISFVEDYEYPFNFLAYTPDTTYTHLGVVQFASSMFYFMEAYVGEIDVLDELPSFSMPVSREEVHDYLRMLAPFGKGRLLHGNERQI